MTDIDVLNRIQDSFRGNAYRFTQHGLHEATADDLTVRQVRDAIISSRAEILEDYPDDPRGSSCLILSWTDDERPIHAVISYSADMAVITVYVPGKDRWQDPRTRRKQ